MGGFVGCKILLIAVLISFVSSKPYDINSALKDIPEEERVRFLKHHIRLGYDLSQSGNTINNLPSLNFELPEEFSIALYQHVRQEHRIEDKAFLSVLGNIICFPNNECIDVGDVGVHPRNLNDK